MTTACDPAGVFSLKVDFNCNFPSVNDNRGNVWKVERKATVEIHVRNSSRLAQDKENYSKKP